MDSQEARPVILAVDDAPENLDVVKSILVPDYVVRAAINGPVALKIAAKQQPDLILLDIMMPGMDGFEVCRKLKNDKTTAHIPVIFLSAELEISNEAMGYELGAEDYVTKPINPVALRASIRNVLG